MKKIRNWLGMLISFIALGWLVSAYDFGEIWPLLRDAKYAYFIPVPALLITDFVLRAMRWRLLFQGATPVRLGNVFGAQMIGYLFNNLLPARGGEFVKIYVLSRTASLSKSEVLATMVVEKTADLLIAMALLTLLLLYYPLPGWVRQAGSVVGAVTFLALGAIVYLRFAGAATVATLFRTLKFVPASLLQRSETAAIQFLSGLSGLSSLAGTLRFAAISVAIWGFELSVMYAVARAFDIPTSAAELLLVMLMILFGTMVPSSPGYIGTYEFFGVSALSLLGIGGGAALSFVIVLHGTTFIGANLIGLICLALFRPGQVLLAADDRPDIEPQPPQAAR